MSQEEVVSKVLSSHEDYKNAEEELKKNKEELAKMMIDMNKKELRPGNKIIVLISQKSVAICRDERSAEYIKKKFWRNFGKKEESEKKN